MCLSLCLLLSSTWPSRQYSCAPALLATIARLCFPVKTVIHPTRQTPVTAFIPYPTPYWLTRIPNHLTLCIPTSTPAQPHDYGDCARLRGWHTPPRYP